MLKDVALVNTYHREVSKAELNLQDLVCFTVLDNFLKLLASLRSLSYLEALEIKSLLCKDLVLSGIGLLSSSQKKVES